MKKRNLIMTIFLTAIISITITTYALNRVNARDVVYNKPNNEETNVADDLDIINHNLIVKNMMNSFGTVEYATSQGTPQLIRTASKQLTRGKYIIITSHGISWNDTGGYGATNEESQATDLSCTNNCTIQLLSGYHNQPKATNPIVDNYKVMESVFVQSYYVEITGESSTLTVTTTSAATYTTGAQYATLIAIPVTMN